MKTRIMTIGQAFAFIFLWCATGLAQTPQPSPPPAAEQPAGMSLKIYAGGEGLLMGDAGSAVTPFARLEAIAPLPLFAGTSTDKNGNAVDKSQWWPQLEVTADFTGLPGQQAQVDITQLDTYKALEVSLGVVQPVAYGGNQRIGIGLEAGFATRLPGKTAPRDTTARWGKVFAEVSQTEGAAYLRVGLGGDQRLEGEYRLTATAEGSVRLWHETAEGSTVKGVEIRLVGDGILGLSVGGFVPATRDVVRVGLVLSR